MTLREFIGKLENYGKQHPEVLDMKVITSDDDEGNSFSEIYFDPSKGKFDGEEFISYDDFKEYDDLEDKDVNAICVN